MGARARGPKGCTPAASYAVYVVYRFGERIFATRASGLAAMLACDYAVDDHVPCRVETEIVEVPARHGRYCRCPDRQPARNAPSAGLGAPSRSSGP